MKLNAGLYFRIGSYHDQQHAYFNLNKSRYNGELFWFLSITPLNSEPGTTDDLDLYRSLYPTTVESNDIATQWECWKDIKTISLDTPIIQSL